MRDARGAARCLRPPCVTERLTALDAGDARRGARAGMGEVLAGAPRARGRRPGLARRTPTTRCGPRCARRAPTWPRSTRPSPPCSRRRSPTSRPAARGARRAAVAPRCRRRRCPRPPERAAEAELEPVPAAWSEVELLRDEGLRRDQRRRARRRAAAAHPPGARGRRAGSAAARARPGAGASVHDLRAHRARVAAPRRRADGAPLPRRRRERPRRLVLVCDVSGSMAPYARMLLQYLQACVAARAPRRGVRVRHAADPAHARARGPRPGPRAAARRRRAWSTWSGGTRIGAALAELNREHGRRIGRGAIVVILSDGWDRGDPDELAAEMARLRRRAHRVDVAQPARPPTRATSR